MELKYSYNPKEEAKTAKAIRRNENISYKKAVIVCDSIRGKNLEAAIKLLEEVEKIKTPIPFKKYRTGASHRRGVGISRYPKKAAAAMLKLLRNIQANAEYKGLDPSKMKIIFAQANKGVSRRRRKPKGRWKAWRTQYVNLQAIAEEM